MKWNKEVSSISKGLKELDGVGATLILMQLALGKDAAYNMAKEFKDMKV